MQIKTTINKNLNNRELIKVQFSSIGMNIWLYVLGFLVIIFFSFFVDSQTASTIGLIALVIFYKFFFHRKNYRKTQIVGKIEIKGDSISLSQGDSEVLFDIKKISDLKITYNGYDGMTIGRYVDNGDLNKISFHYLDKLYKYQFDLDSIERIADLKTLFQTWYSMGIKFKEYYKGKRSFLFESHIEYNEIQELKRKYKIDWI
jgi:hypothetical protein